MVRAKPVTTSSAGHVPTKHWGIKHIGNRILLLGLIAAGNSVFIPFCKHYFDLDQFQSQLVDFAFYTAYYIGALLYSSMAHLGKGPCGEMGYKTKHRVRLAVLRARCGSHDHRR